MKTLVIPDIHLKHEKAERIIAQYPADKIIFLGDYFDDFYDGPIANRATAEWLASSLNVPGRIHLAGNHDVSYYHEKHRCSGWTQKKQWVLDDYRSLLGKLLICAEEDGFLFSHAGFNQTHNPGDYWGYPLSYFSTNDPVFWVSKARGGQDPCSGPLWLDYSEFLGISYHKQIFGHTPGPTVRQPKYSPQSYCIDTHLNHVCLIEDGKVEIISTKDI